jgi:hypothetical protein
MRQLIGQRSGADLTPRNRPQSVFGTPLRPHHSVDSPMAFTGPSTSSLEPLIYDAEMKLDNALSNQEALLKTIQQLQGSYNEVRIHLCFLSFKSQVLNTSASE